MQDVLDVFDASHREIMIRLDALLQLVYSVQGAEWSTGAGDPVRELITFFTGPAREHNYEEEKHIFPALLQSDDVDVRRAAECLREDHAWIELYWLDIEPQLTAALEGRSSFDQQYLQKATELFAALMREHIALEESLLYPQLRGRLKSMVTRSIRREMMAHRAAKSDRAG